MTDYVPFMAIDLREYIHKDTFQCLLGTFQKFTMLAWICQAEYLNITQLLTFWHVTPPPTPLPYRCPELLLFLPVEVHASRRNDGMYGESVFFPPFTVISQSSA